MMKDKRVEFKNRLSRYIGSMLIGLVFAAGCTLCTGPILLSVFALAGPNQGSGLVYMRAYTLGFTIPFFVLSFFIGKMQWIRTDNVKIVKIGGYVRIVMGLILFFDWLMKIIIYLSPIFGGFTGF